VSLAGNVYQLQELRGANCSGMVPTPNAGFACGQVITEQATLAVHRVERPV